MDNIGGYTWPTPKFPTLPPIASELHSFHTHIFFHYISYLRSSKNTTIYGAS